MTTALTYPCYGMEYLAEMEAKKEKQERRTAEAWVSELRFYNPHFNVKWNRWVCTCDPYIQACGDQGLDAGSCLHTQSKSKTR